MAQENVPTYPQNTVVLTSDTITDEVQKWTLTGVGAAKKWTVEIDGQKSSDATLVGNASAATVLTALEKLPNINPGDLTITGSAGGPYTVTYLGTGAFGNINVATPVFTAEEGSVASADVTVGGAPTKAVQLGSGNADGRGRTSPNAGKTPAEKRAANESAYQ